MWIFSHSAPRLLVCQNMQFIKLGQTPGKASRRHGAWTRLAGRGWAGVEAKQPDSGTVEDGRPLQPQQIYAAVGQKPVGEIAAAA